MKTLFALALGRYAEVVSYLTTFIPPLANKQGSFLIGENMIFVTRLLSFLRFVWLCGIQAFPSL